MDQERQDRYIEELRKMIRIDTVSDPNNGSPQENFEKFRELLWELFPNIRKVCELWDFNGALLLKWKGSDQNSLPVLFMNHYDVVPADPAGWKHPPFSADVADGKIWGRGTLDDKGGVWAMFRAADELAASGFVPSRDIYFETDYSEETVGKGADDITQWMVSEGIKLEMVFDEGGDIVYEPISGAKGTFAMIGVGEKSGVNLKFTARSDGGHASTPPKNTPLIQLSKFMVHVDRNNVFDVSMPEPVIEMLKTIAPYMGKAGKILAGADKYSGPIGKLMTLLGPTAKSMITTTIAFTLAGGGEAVNAIPREVWVIGDMRCSHHQGMQASIDRITQVAKKYGIDTEVITTGVESRLTDHKGKAYRLVEEAVKATVPGVDACSPYIMTGASDARYFDRVCGQCIRFLPFTINTEQMDAIHGINEYLSVDTLIPAVEYYKYMMQHV